MSSYWTNFAKTGDPNGPGLAKWPIYQPGVGGRVMELGSEITDRVEPYRARYEFFDVYYKKSAGQ